MSLLGFAAVALSAGLAVADDGHQADPLELIAGYGVTSYYSLGEDHWEVWVCKSSEGDLDISASGIAKVLQSELTPYFSWLSGKRYRPVFTAGNPGEVAAAGFAQCLDAVADHVGAGVEGVITVVDQETGFARGDPGGWSLRWSEGFRDLEVALDGTLFPDNGRSVNAGGEMVTLPAAQSQEGQTPPLISIVAHEFGHTLWFPHSYRFDPAEYDNPMDIMSHAEAAPGLQIGTIAINRYAAGWISRDDIEFYTGEGTNRYSLASPGDHGTQMLILGSGQGGFLTLGSRVRKGYDSGLPKEGVESYFIDVETSDCGGSGAKPPCFGLHRPTQAVTINPTVPLDYHNPTAHVMGVGEGYMYGDISVKVVERQGDNFVIEISDGSLSIKDTAPPPVNTENLPGFYTEAYDADPLDLIASYDVTTAYTLDRDLWEVWVCKTSDGYLDISPQSAAQQLQTKVAPYFVELSGGRYRPVFRVGGSIDISLDNGLEYGNCETLVGNAIRKRATGTRPEGVLLLSDRVVFESSASIGDQSFTQSSVLALNAVTYPQNNREYVSGGRWWQPPTSFGRKRFRTGLFPIWPRMGLGILQQ